MTPAAYLEDVLLQLHKLKSLADGAIEQLPPGRLMTPLDGETNSVGLVMKHVAGNMRSRWTDFLTTDGEKPDRARDTEFELDAADTKDRLTERWEAGWSLTLATIGALAPDDLERGVTIRGEPHTVLQAIQRQLLHYSYHVGQIVLLARHWAGPEWRSLSIPRGRSAEWDVSKDGVPYDTSAHAPDGSRNA
ncbi:MAG: DUF1572 family protein [Planctomycetota bacterium]|jgi:hypothetical protein